MPDYDRPFALSDNPFSPGPSIGGDAPEWGSTDALWTKPLRIHRVPQLEDLFVTEAGSFKKYLERFDEEMDNNRFSKEKPSAPQVTLKFLIRGPAGSGKTTFANYLAGQLSQYKLPPDKDWKTVDYRNVTASESMDSPTRIDKIAYVFGEQVKQTNFGGLILDNLEASDEQSVLGLLATLGRERTIVAFLVARDNSEFGRSAETRSLYSAEFDLNFLKPEQAICFVKERLLKFRKTVKNVPPWINQDRWALFPFSRDHIETGVKLGVLGDSPEKRALPTIRNLASILKTALEDEVRRLRRDGGQDIRAIGPTDIENRVINLLHYVARLTSSLTGSNGRDKAP